MQDGFELLANKQVGLITNHTALVDTVHLIDILHNAEEVELSMLFGPEHGLRGLASAGAHVSDGVDDATGIPVVSLYGTNRKPSADDLAALDVLVFDIQDIGARFYTYISTMGLAMQAAAEVGLPFVVLDRPNVIGGEYVGGWVLEKGFESFVGQYPIPVAHGMTVGELATMIVAERMLPGLDPLDLTVVPVINWQRDQQWAETGLPWIRTSPNIPDFETALVYPGTCLVEGTTLSEGRGTDMPFRMVGGPGIEVQSLLQTLRDAELPGVVYQAASFSPRVIEGVADSPQTGRRRSLGSPTGGHRPGEFPTGGDRCSRAGCSIGSGRTRGTPKRPVGSTQRIRATT